MEELSGESKEADVGLPFHVDYILYYTIYLWTSFIFFSSPRLVCGPVTVVEGINKEDATYRASVDGLGGFDGVGVLGELPREVFQECLPLRLLSL